jgi:hypothetical protein
VADLNTLFLFVFLYSVLVVIRNITGFLLSIYQDPPIKYRLSLFRGLELELSIIYMVTYLIKIL